MERTLGFVGAGNMAGAILSGILAKALVPAEHLWMFDRAPEKLEPWREKGVQIAQSNAQLAQRCDVVLLAVKPQSFDEVLQELSPHTAGRCVLSIAAGISTSYLKDWLPEAMVVRVMPNTPLQVGRGATAVAQAPDVPDELFGWLCSLFAAAGEVAVIPEAQMDDIIAVSGSSPAFFFRMAAAMVAEAERAGIDPALALRMAARTMEGSATMLLESGKTAKELETMVCSPGGTTLAALSAFDEFRFEEMYREAARRCAERSRELGR
ncbi:MAG: pyrroline-5-carboxylate reductase [Muribaculaceae bacterium]|nr:pyrroline-5-carboxylate reductase [Muribaculaceae bacterium]